MNKLNKRQKYIKDKYFEVKGNDPFYYYPKSDKMLYMSPYTFDRVLDLIIKILEQEIKDFGV